MNTAKKTGGGFAAALIFATCRALASYHPAAQAMGDDKGLTYSYARFGDRAMIYASGDISMNERDHFNAWLATRSQEQRASIRVGMTTLSLDSPGGVIGGARHLAGWVKDNQIDTVVANASTCASAGVMIWGAGGHKAAGVNAQIGVHGASSAVASNDDAVAASTLFVARALADEKAPPTVVAAVATTASSDMHWLTAADAVAWGATVLDKDGNPES
jgi:hypothetical protein